MFGVAAIIRSGSAGEPTVPTKELVILTTSVSSTWSLNTFVNSGGSMSWSVSGGVTIAEQEYLGNDKPILDLSSNTGTARISIKSTTDFVGFTEMWADADKTADNITSIDLREATDLIALSCKLHPNLNSIDLSTLVDLQEITLRGNNFDSIDVSNNPDIFKAYIYGNNFTDYNVLDTPLVTTLALNNNNINSTELDRIVNRLDALGEINGRLWLDGNTGSLTVDAYYGHLNLISKGWTIDVAEPPSPVIPPVDGVELVLSNFHIKDTFPNRVYFNSSTEITLSTVNGFVVSGKSFLNDTAVTVNTGQLTDHYFTMSSDFNYFDNNTIRLGENDSTGDVNATIHNFTLTYIENNIDEPVSTDFKYASPSGSGSQDGTSEANAWSFATALNNDAAGRTIWCKAGDLGAAKKSFSGRVYPVDNPCKYIGYKTSTGGVPDEITTNYWDYGVTMLTTEMPTFTSSSDYNLRIQNSAGFIFRNFQAQNGDSCVERYEGADNCEFDTFNISTMLAGGIAMESRTEMPYVNKIRAVNCRVEQCDATQIILRGNSHNMIKDCKAYVDDSSGVPDYSITVGGSNSIAIGCYAENFLSTQGSLHGVSLRAAEWPSAEYNLVQDCESVNFAECYAFRNHGMNKSVIKDSIARNNGAIFNNDRGGIIFDGPGAWNVAENVNVDECDVGIGFYDDGVESANISIGDHAVIKNCIISNCPTTIFLAGASNDSSTNAGISFYNNTFYNSTSFINQHQYHLNLNGGVDFINNIIDSISAGITNEPYPSDFTFTNNDFFNNGAWEDVYIGSDGNIDVDPQLDASFVPQADFSLISKPRIDGVYYDMDGVTRADPTTLGAKLSPSEEAGE